MYGKQLYGFSHEVHIWSGPGYSVSQISIQLYFPKKILICCIFANNNQGKNDWNMGGCNFNILTSLRAVNPLWLQILRIDGEGIINDVICGKKKKHAKKKLLE